ncbi:MAG TPA: PCYCGC motif-containing (lipo)protein [Candidatus Limnocylindrales bacterium]|nr:PCYCGC motif-containing (lipo)protein [Candidatus Limnocylindrales bacterium]
MNPSRSRTLRRRIVVGWLPVLLLFVLGGSMAGCAGANDVPSVTYAAPAVGATAEPVTSPVVDPAAAGGHTMNHAMPAAAEAEAAWSARPDYVRTADARTQEAYAFAIARPDVVDWMPCYCGCVAMDHRNNTDCYIKPRTEGAQVVYDEHASYCTICVDISLMAKAMTAEGRSLIDIRAAVDVTYGSIAPGTDTPLPPG